MINYELRDLKNEIQQMSENEIKCKRPDVIVNLVEKIPDVNERQLDRFYTPRGDTSHFGIKEMLENEEETLRDMPELESEESAGQRRNQSAKGLKILTPEQMFRRPPISLVQLKAGNTSEKLENEIRQLLYSLYKSKNLSKTIYNNLINAV